MKKILVPLVLLVILMTSVNTQAACITFTMSDGGSNELETYCGRFNYKGDTRTFYFVDKNTYVVIDTWWDSKHDGGEPYRPMISELDKMVDKYFGHNRKERYGYSDDPTLKVRKAREVGVYIVHNKMMYCPKLDKLKSGYSVVTHKNFVSDLKELDQYLASWKKHGSPDQ
ncbi:MAG: hypothetical protein HQK60_02975 [Deltaproteobacteria bacterium]|nr:hypothetical protein [Deltaproteobacteria bacterium]